MPLEIRELQIRVNVGEGADTGASSSGGATGSTQDNALVKEIVEKVLQAIKEKQER